MNAILLDQGLAPQAAALLREQGFDAVHVAEIGMERAEDLDRQNKTEGLVDVSHATGGHVPGGIQRRSVGIEEPACIERAQLKAQKDGVLWQTSFGGRYADIRRIVAGNVGGIGANYHRNHQRLTVDRIA